VQLDQLPLPIAFGKHDPAVVVVIMRIVIVMMMMNFRSHLRGLGLFQFFLKPLFDPRVFAISFDLFNLEGNAETFGKIAFGHGKVTGLCRAGVEVLVIPKVRW